MEHTVRQVRLFKNGTMGVGDLLDELLLGVDDVRHDRRVMMSR